MQLFYVKRNKANDALLHFGNQDLTGESLPTAKRLGAGKGLIGEDVGIGDGACLLVNGDDVGNFVGVGGTNVHGVYGIMIERHCIPFA